MNGIHRLLSIVSIVSLATGCATFSPPAEKPELRGDATPLPTTRTRDTLASLPPPKGPIAVSVYAVKDQTGQYKPAPSNSFSTAVMQGATAVLVKALLDSKWFVPLEREGLQNLLTERKIIRAAKNPNRKKIPTLASASLIIEGSIIAYDSNIRTGGAGARYLGIGISQQYREDQVTINLRAVDVRTGRILHSVTSTKTIFSRQLDSGIFGYIRFGKLLEVETGYSYNEPAQLCVMDAIESALIQLIAEGIQRGTWKLKNPEDISHPVFARFGGNWKG